MFRIIIFFSLCWVFDCCLFNRYQLSIIEQVIEYESFSLMRDTVLHSTHCVCHAITFWPCRSAFQQFQQNKIPSVIRRICCKLLSKYLWPILSRSISQLKLLLENFLIGCVIRKCRLKVVQQQCDNLVDSKYSKYSKRSICWKVFTPRKWYFSKQSLLVYWRGSLFYSYAVDANNPQLNQLTCSFHLMDHKRIPHCWANEDHHPAMMRLQLNISSRNFGNFRH